MSLKYRLPREANVQSVNTSGEGSQHVQFFTKKSLYRLFETTGFKIINSRSSDFISGIIPFNHVIRKSALLCRIDFALADVLPSAVVSGWYFTLRKSDYWYDRKLSSAGIQTRLNPANLASCDTGSNYTIHYCLDSRSLLPRLSRYYVERLNSLKKWVLLLSLAPLCTQVATKSDC
jgi:hypothetical protein